MNLSPAEIELLRSETKRPAALGIILSFTIIAFIFVSLRLTTRFMVIKNQGFEDYFIAVAMVRTPLTVNLDFFFRVLTLMFVKVGIDRHGRMHGQTCVAPP